MGHDSAFDSTENQALLAVCARKTIRNAAILGVVWGCINLFIGFFAFQTNPVNAGILVLAFFMLGAGVFALWEPSLRALLSEAIVSALLFCWNLGILMLNLREGFNDQVQFHGVVFPAIAAVVFFRQYKLGHLNETIIAMDSAAVKEASGLCKQLFKSKLKEAPDIAEASSRRCRMRFMSNSVFCAQRNLTHAFHMNRANFQRCVEDTDKKRIRVVVRHPLGKLTYAFDKKNSDKIRGWLTAPTLRPKEAAAVPPHFSKRSTATST